MQMLSDPVPQPCPLASLAGARLARLGRMAGVDLPGASELLVERARLNRLAVPGKVSAAGGCKLYQARDGWIALNLARADDAELLPALLQSHDVGDLRSAIATREAGDLLARGRMLGLAIAGLDEMPASPPITVTQAGGNRATTTGKLLKVIDLSALWAGPLASRLLRLAGCDVVRMESRGREDPLRESDPAHFAALNAGKQEVALDLKSDEGRAQLLDMIGEADIVIEAARPRALLQLGIDADALVRVRPGLSWITITAHGIAGDAAHWVGFGDDTAVAGGLSRELREVSGRIGFVGDAIGDPVTGIAAAELALRQARAGAGGRFVLSMSALVAEAIAFEKQDDAAAWRDGLQRWAEAEGVPFTDAFAPAKAGTPC